MTTTTIPQVKTPIYVAPEWDDELDRFVLYARVGKAAWPIYGATFEECQQNYADYQARLAKNTEADLWLQTLAEESQGALAKSEEDAYYRNPD